jgi:hypothetical protein
MGRVKAEFRKVPRQCPLALLIKVDSSRSKSTKRTSHFTIAKINWLKLFKVRTAV